MNLRFINGWIAQLVEPMPSNWGSLPVAPAQLEQLTLAAGQEYRLVLVQTVDVLQQARREVIGLALDDNGAYVVTRGLEGTEAQSWAVGDIAMAAVTAGMLQWLADNSGHPGAAGRGIESVIVDGDDRLIVTYTDGSSVDAGYVRGAEGIAGRGISSVQINTSGRLIVTYTDGTTEDAGQVTDAGSGGESVTVGLAALNEYWEAFSPPPQATKTGSTIVLTGCFRTVSDIFGEGARNIMSQLPEGFIPPFQYVNFPASDGQTYTFQVQVDGRLFLEPGPEIAAGVVIDLNGITITV